MSRAELDEMMAFLVEFAKLMLADQGEFYPFGAGMKPDGEMTSLGADTGAAGPKSADVIGLLHSALVDQASKGEIDAAGICMDVRITPPGTSGLTDAICVELEHRDGEAVHVFVPYVITALGVVSYGETFASPGESVIFLPVAG